jgi:Cell wall-active antibiotics response 4TMS YvqF
MKNQHCHSHRFRGLGFGLFLVLIGSLILGFNFGYIPHELKSIVFSIPAFIIFIGIINVFKRHFIMGFFWVLLGTFFLIPRIIEVYPNAFPGIDVNFTHVYWPLFLILGGIFIVVKRIFFPNYWSKRWAHLHDYRKGEYCHHGYKNYGNKYSKWEKVENGKWEKKGNGFSKSSVFSSVEHIVLDPEFKGGQLDAVFGGIVIDLRKTSLPEGETVLEINAVFGGITVYVPSEWSVETNLNSVFGGFQDNRNTSTIQDPSRKLIIIGECVFGGGELRN